MTTEKRHDLLKSFAIVLCLTSWAVSAILIFFCFTLYLRDIKLKSYAAVLENNIVLLNKNLKQYQESAGERSKLEENAMDYLRWKFVLKEQVDGAGDRLSEKGAALKNMKKDKELANLIYYNLGLSYTMAVNFESAIKAFEEALQYDPKDAWSCYDLGLLYSAYRTDQAKGISYYERYLELAPSGAKAREVKERVDTLKKGRPNI